MIDKVVDRILLDGIIVLYDAESDKILFSDPSYINESRKKFVIENRDSIISELLRRGLSSDTDEGTITIAVSNAFRTIMETEDLRYADIGIGERCLFCRRCRTHDDWCYEMHDHWYSLPQAKWKDKRLSKMPVKELSWIVNKLRLEPEAELYIKQLIAEKEKQK